MSNLSNTHFKRKCRVESAVLPSHSMSSLKKTKVSPSYGKHIEDNICIYHLDMATKVKVIPLQVWWQKFNRKSTCTTQGKKSRRMANDDRIYQLAEVECNQRNAMSDKTLERVITKQKRKNRKLKVCFKEI